MDSIVDVFRKSFSVRSLKTLTGLFLVLFFSQTLLADVNSAIPDPPDPLPTSPVCRNDDGSRNFNCSGPSYGYKWCDSINSTKEVLAAASGIDYLGTGFTMIGGDSSAANSGYECLYWRDRAMCPASKPNETGGIVTNLDMCYKCAIGSVEGTCEVECEALSCGGGGGGATVGFGQSCPVESDCDAEDQIGSGSGDFCRNENGALNGLCSPITGSSVQLCTDDFGALSNFIALNNPLYTNYTYGGFVQAEGDSTVCAYFSNGLFCPSYYPLLVEGAIYEEICRSDGSEPDPDTDPDPDPDSDPDSDPDPDPVLPGPGGITPGDKDENGNPDPEGDDDGDGIPNGEDEDWKPEPPVGVGCPVPFDPFWNQTKWDIENQTWGAWDCKFEIDDPDSTPGTTDPELVLDCSSLDDAAALDYCGGLKTDCENSGGVFWFQSGNPICTPVEPVDPTEPDPDPDPDGGVEHDGIIAAIESQTSTLETSISTSGNGIVSAISAQTTILAAAIDGIQNVGGGGVGSGGGTDLNGDGEGEGEGWGLSSGGLDCITAPACDGDEVQCNILFQQWKTRCDAEMGDLDARTEWTGFDDLSATVDDARSDYDTAFSLIQAEVEAKISNTFSGGTAQLPTFQFQWRNGAPITFDLNKWSTTLGGLGNLFFMACTLLAVFIILRPR